jgi:aryl-alcohol dehydrogenase-like predicted oxidoreductase
VNYRRLGGTGPKVSELSLGTWLTVGHALDLNASRSLVRGAFESGINFFDTAQSYPGAEEMPGVDPASLSPREYVVASKCYFPRPENEGVPGARGLSRKNIRQSVDDSLCKLRVEWIDIYYCHRFDPDIPLEETIGTLDD